MKKFLIITSILLTTLIIQCVNAETGVTEIECSMNTQTKYAYNNRIVNESIYVQKFKIDDINKQLLIYSTGREAPIGGYNQIFNKDEIVIQGAKPDDKTTLGLKIDRRSGTIFMKNTEANKWWGDIITTYHGTCGKLEGQKF